MNRLVLSSDWGQWDVVSTDGHTDDCVPSWGTAIKRADFEARAECKRPLAREDGCQVTHRPTPDYAPPPVEPGDHRPDVDEPSDAVSRLLGTR